MFVGFANGMLHHTHTFSSRSFGIVYEKGYQKFGPVAGVVTTKLKGASIYDGSYGDFNPTCNGTDNFTFDVGDFVIPPQVRLYLASQLLLR